MKPISAILQEWTEVFAHRSMRDFKRFMDDTGLSPSQVNTLMRLHYGRMCGVTDVAGHLGITNAAASQMIERLVQMGLLARTESPADRRVKQLTLTDAGRTLVQDGIEARRRWMEDLVETLTPDEQATIASALTILTEAAKKLEKTSS
jgi:DNA-binding MarR family transcriptional regulator